MPVMTRAEKAGYDETAVKLPTKLAKDGFDVMGGDLQMGSNKVTQVKDAEVSSDGPNLGQVEDKFALGSYMNRRSRN